MNQAIVLHDGNSIEIIRKGSDFVLTIRDNDLEAVSCIMDKDELFEVIDMFSSMKYTR